jgi:hypothetical protein
LAAAAAEWADFEAEADGAVDLVVSFEAEEPRSGVRLWACKAASTNPEPEGSIHGLNGLRLPKRVPSEHPSSGLKDLMGLE